MFKNSKSLTPDLEKLILDRRDEARKNLRQKLKKEREEIQALKKNEKNAKHPLYIFPAEMWAEILSFLKKSSDLENAGKSAELFYDLLESRRLSEVLLPHLLGVKGFRKHFEKPVSYDEYDPTSHESPLEMLPLRGVSDTWRDAIDKCLVSYLEHYVLSNSHDMEAILPLLRIAPTARSMEILENIVRDYTTEDEKAKLERFPKRCLHVSWDVAFPFTEDFDRFQNDTIRFDEKISKLLNALGEELLYFTVDVSLITILQSRTSLLQVFSLLCKWFSFIPNIRWAKIIFNGAISLFPREVFTPTLQDFLRETPNPPQFPRLQNLEKLSLVFFEANEEGTEIFEEVLSSNLHIKKLNLVGNFNTGLQSLVGIIKSRLKLDTFFFECLSETLIDDLQAIVAEPHVWPLKEIKLRSRMCYDETIREIFRFLEKFQTLEVVSLDFKHLKREQQTPYGKEGGDEKLYLRLPNLSQFNLRYHVYQYKQDMDVKPELLPSIDCLLYCSKLSKVSWFNRAICLVKDEDDELEKTWKNDIIDFRSGKLDLRESNIWKVFPNLESVQLPDFKDWRFHLEIITHKRGERIFK